MWTHLLSVVAQLRKCSEKFMSSGAMQLRRFTQFPRLLAQALLFFSPVRPVFASSCETLVSKLFLDVPGLPWTFRCF